MSPERRLGPSWHNMAEICTDHASCLAMCFNLGGDRGAKMLHSLACRAAVDHDGARRVGFRHGRISIVHRGHHECHYRAWNSARVE